jgi:hypothetical protein
METVFNIGIGFVMILSPYYAESIQRQLEARTSPMMKVGIRGKAMVRRPCKCIVDRNGGRCEVPWRQHERGDELIDDHVAQPPERGNAEGILETRQGRLSASLAASRQ